MLFPVIVRIYIYISLHFFSFPFFPLDIFREEARWYARFIFDVEKKKKVFIIAWKRRLTSFAYACRLERRWRHCSTGSDSSTGSSEASVWTTGVAQKLAKANAKSSSDMWSASRRLVRGKNLEEGALLVGARPSNNSESSDTTDTTATTTTTTMPSKLTTVVSMWCVSRRTHVTQPDTGIFLYEMYCTCIGRVFSILKILKRACQTGYVFHHKKRTREMKRIFILLWLFYLINYFTYHAKLCFCSHFFECCWIDCLFSCLRFLIIAYISLLITF